MCCWLNLLFISPVCVSVAGAGVFQGVASGTSNHSPVVVSLRRLLRQKSRVFAWSGARGRRWSGRINVPAQCGVHPGGDAYLLTGSVHFGEAWLGCAPRYKDFLQLYTTAEKAGTNPCQIDTDWEISAWPGLNRVGIFSEKKSQWEAGREEQTYGCLAMKGFFRRLFFRTYRCPAAQETSGESDHLSRHESPKMSPFGSTCTLFVCECGREWVDGRA